MKKQMIVTLAMVMLSSSGFAGNAAKSIDKKAPVDAAGKAVTETREQKLDKYLKSQEVSALTSTITAALPKMSPDTVTAAIKSAYSRSNESGIKVVTSLRALEPVLKNLNEEQLKKVQDYLEGMSTTSIDAANKSLSPAEIAKVNENMIAAEAFLEALPGVLKDPNSASAKAWFGKMDIISGLLKSGLQIDQAIADKRTMTDKERENLLKCLKG